MINNNKISYIGHKYYFYSFYKVNKLRNEYESENNINYDLCIKLRPDIILKNKLNLNILDKNKIYLFGNPKKKNYDLKNINNFQAVNVITISNSIIMDKIANFYEKFDYYLLHQKNPRHTDYVDYILDLGISYIIQDYIYKRDWAFIRL